MEKIAFLILLPMAMFFLGCAHEQFMTDARHPEVAVSESGNVTYRGEIIDPEDLPDLLKKSGLTREDTIHIHIVSGLKDYRHPYYVLGILVKNGFTRSVFVEDRQSFSEVGSGKKPPAASSATVNGGRRPIRYKN